MLDERPYIARMLGDLDEDIAGGIHQQLLRTRAPPLLRIQAIDEGSNVLLVNRVENLGLAAEVVIQRRLAQTDLIRQHLHGRAVIAAGIEQIRAALDDLLALVVMRRTRRTAAL